MMAIRHPLPRGARDGYPKLGWYAGTGFAVVWIALAGCAKPVMVSPTPEVPLFRSAEFIIYRLDSDQTPAQLAERFLGTAEKAWMVTAANPGAGFRAGQPVVIPLVWRNTGGLHADGYQTVPILTYHRFAEECQSPLCMPAAAFKEQMRYLKEGGYHAIAPDDLLAFLEYRKPLPPKSVLISIDDGYRSAYDIAYPILRAYGFTATLFIYTELIDGPALALSWNQLLEMKREGFTIGSHTVYHSDLTQAREGETPADFAARVEKELVSSKQLLDRKLGQNTWLLAYPYGNYDQKVIASTRQAGYRLAMSVKRGGNPFFANALALRRDQILERDLPTFARRLKTFTSLSLE